MGKLLGRFLKSEEGTTAVEYGLIAAGIALVGTNLTTTISSVANAIR